MAPSLSLSHTLRHSKKTAKQLPNINIYMYIVNYLVFSYSFDNKDFHCEIRRSDRVEKKTKGDHHLRGI